MAFSRTFRPFPQLTPAFNRVKGQPPQNARMHLRRPAGKHLEENRLVPKPNHLPLVSEQIIVAVH